MVGSSSLPGRAILFNNAAVAVAEALPVSFDAFISYSSRDKTVADAVCARLESAGIRCWIAPRDVLAGRSYGEAIIEAIHSAKVMVLVFSSNANSSTHIAKEVERAVSHGVAILPFQIENVAPGISLDYFIGSVHWLDAMTPPMEKHLDDLAATVHKLLPLAPGQPGVPAVQPPEIWERSAPGNSPTSTSGVAAPSLINERINERASRAASSKTIWIGLAAVVLAVIVAGLFLLRGSGNSRSADGGDVIAPSPGPGPKSGAIRLSAAINGSTMGRW
jgi:hypothetical protein